MCTFINPYFVCDEVHHFCQVGENEQIFKNQIIVLPNSKNNCYSFYALNANPGPTYSTLHNCAEFLNCSYYDGKSLKPCDEKKDDSYPLYKEVKIYMSLSKAPYKIWNNVRMIEDDSVIEIYSSDGSRIEAFYTKDIDGGAFLAIGNK